MAGISLDLEDLLLDLENPRISKAERIKKRPSATLTAAASGTYLSNRELLRPPTSEISRPSRDKTTPRANQQNLSSLVAKNIPLNVSGKSAL
jgi:hypothetical protein